MSSIDGSSTRHLLEAALERSVALQVLAVLVERRRPDRLQLAAGERRLQDRGCVDRTLGRTGPDEVMELVDEEDDVAPLHDLLHHLLEPLLELAAVLGAGDEGGQIQGVDLLVLQQLGHLVRGDARREPFDDGGLADARLADQHGVVLLAAREDLHHALDLGLAPDDGIELPVRGGLGEIAAELVEQLRALRLLSRGAAGALLAPAGAGQHADDLVADLLGVGVEVEQDARGDAFVLAHEPEQDVLGADVVVSERQRLAEGQLEDLLRARREGDLAGRDLVALADDARHLRAHFLDCDVERLEHARGETFLFAEEAEENVLGTDVVVLEGAGLVLREDDDLASPFCESLEHPCRPSFQPITGGKLTHPPSRRSAPMVSDGCVVPVSEIRRRRAERREEDHVPDRLASGQHHRQPVDPEPQPAGRRHAVGERLHVVRILLLAFDELGLAPKALPLLLGVVDLRERVPELHPADEILEALGQRLVVVGGARERRDLDRVVVHDRRLDQARLDVVAEGMVDQLRPVLVCVGVDLARVQLIAERRLVANPEAVLGERIREANPLPGRLQVELVTLEGRLRRPHHLERDRLDQPLHPLHRVAVVRVRLVPLEHRELVRVLVRDALVAEVLADLVDALEPADDQPLQIELGRDPEIEVLLEVVPVRDERLREGAAVARLQHRRLDLDEAVGVEVAPDRRDDAAAQEEVRARLLVHQQVEVALSVPQLDVGEAVEGVRQRRTVLREQLEVGDLQRRLAPARLRRMPLHADDVAEIDVDLLGDQLDPAAPVDEVEERDLPHLAPRHHAAGEAELLRLVLRARLERLGVRADRSDLVPVGKALRNIARV